MKQKKQTGSAKAIKKVVAIPQDPGVQNRLKKTLGIIIAVFAFALYAQSISFNYAFDDPTVTKDNKIVTKGIAGISTLLVTDYWHGLGEGEYRIPEYRPVPLIMTAIEWQLSPDNPHLYHLINVILYALTCWLLFLLLCTLFKTQNLIFPFVCSLLYVAHPIHTEVVDNIKGSDEILCFLFALLSAFLIVKSVEKKSLVGLIFAAICYLISLLSKETGIAYLILTPVILYVFTKADYKKIISIALMLIVVTSLFFFIRHKVLAQFSLQSFDSPLNNSLLTAPDFISQKATAFYILLRYILLLIFPHPLSYDYSIAQIPLQKMSDLPAIIGIIIYFVIGIYAVLKIKNKSYVAFAILFFLLTLVPVSNIFILIGSTMAERFMYMPSLGFCMLLAFLVIKLTKTETIKGRFNNIRQLLSTNSTLFVIVFILTGLYSFKTFSRNPDWKDNVSLFGHDVQVANNSARAHYDWGITLLNDFYPKESNEEQKHIYMDKAITEFKKALSFYNGFPDAYANLALCYQNINDYKDGISVLEEYCQLFKTPNKNVYNTLAVLFYSAKDYNKALSFCDSALKYDPENTTFYNNKGSVLSELKRYDDAFASFQKAIDLNPKYADAYKSLGLAYLNAGKYSEAINASKKAIAIDPQYASAYCVIGGAYCNLKQYTTAVEFLNKALSINPSDALSRKFLGITYLNMGDTLKAKEFLDMMKSSEKQK